MKIGRNDLCPCGSGKKYKKCCLPKQQIIAEKQDDSHELDYIHDYAEGTPAFNDMMVDIMVGFHSLLLKSLPHIKEYKKIRKMHQEIVSSMVRHFESGKFEQTIEKAYIPESGAPTDSVIVYDTEFDFESREGAQAFFDMVIYKPAPNMNCITELFINSHRYRKPEKVEFLQSMLDSELGLFEITGIDMQEGYAYVQEVFKGSEYTLTDLGLSAYEHEDGIYLYTRIITYREISFSTGLNLAFKKKDPFIIGFIDRWKTNYVEAGEYGRFLELYNRYTKGPKGVKVVINN